jgi:hypothetical protein
MSLLWRRGLPGPIEAMMARESGWTGQSETSWFHGLSGGKTWSERRIVSASGVSKRTGFVSRSRDGVSGSAALVSVVNPASADNIITVSGATISPYSC